MTPVGNPTGLTVAIEDDLVRLRWTPSDPASGNTRFFVLRRLNAPVEGPQDALATEVFFGPTDTAFDEVSALLPDLPETARTYSYAVYGCSGVTGDTCESIGSAATLTPSLRQALHAGGYTIWWRHADANVCADLTCLGKAENTTTPNWWKSCNAACPAARGICPDPGTNATARQLNTDGVTRATAIGDAFDTLGLPVGRVVSSEYCRCFTTAELMDFGPTIELDQGITFFVYDEANRCAHSYDFINQAPAVGTNTALIGHAGFVGDCPILNQLAWSEAAIFKPDGQGGNAFITRLTWDQWAALQ
jgi:phosphohistidine phosphatase SixA